MVQEDQKDDRNPTNGTEDRSAKGSDSGVKRSYVNAKDVLPAELLAAVQERYSGLMWVPISHTFYDERRELVLGLKANGVSTAEVARLAKITPRRVRQIVRQAKLERISDKSDVETVGKP